MYYNKGMKDKILIADDSMSCRTYHKEIIRELYGDLFEIVLADSAKEALRLIRHNLENPFVLILTDMQMETDYEPKEAGEWLIEHIQSIPEYNKSKIVIISGLYNIEYFAEKLNVECISKSLLAQNKLLVKFMMEKLFPYLNKI